MIYISIFFLSLFLFYTKLSQWKWCFCGGNIPDWRHPGKWEHRAKINWSDYPTENWLFHAIRDATRNIVVSEIWLSSRHQFVKKNLLLAIMDISASEFTFLTRPSLHHPSLFLCSRGRSLSLLLLSVYSEANRHPSAPSIREIEQHLRVGG